MPEGEKDFIRLLSICIAGVAIWRKEIDIIIFRRLSSRAVLRRSQEQIANAVNIVGSPVQRVFVDFKVRNLFLYIPFKAFVNYRKEIPIELIILNHCRFLCNLLVVVDVFLQIKIVLSIVSVVFDKLPGYRGHDILHHHTDKTIKGFGTLIRHSIEVQAEIITQILRRQASADADIAGRQTMDA